MSVASRNAALAHVSPQEVDMWIHDVGYVNVADVDTI